jgi:hypothetical protein
MALRQAVLPRQLRGHTVQVAQHGFVRFRGFPGIGEMLARNYQDMDGSLRVDVMEGDAKGILIDDSGGKLFAKDFAEDASGVRHGRSFRLPQSVVEPDDEAG